MEGLLRVFHARDLAEGGDESAPVVALFGEYAAAGVGNAVVAPPALSGLLDPAAFDPAAILEPVQRGVERGEGEAQAAAGPFGDQPGDLVAVVMLVLDDGEDDQLGAAFLASSSAR